jgi:predicted RNase H-like nuclease (RuvC/YqgF family)
MIGKGGAPGKKLEIMRRTIENYQRQISGLKEAIAVLENPASIAATVSNLEAQLKVWLEVRDDSNKRLSEIEDNETQIEVLQEMVEDQQARMDYLASQNESREPEMPEVKQV